MDLDSDAPAIEVAHHDGKLVGGLGWRLGQAEQLHQFENRQKASVQQNGTLAVDVLEFGG